MLDTNETLPTHNSNPDYPVKPNFEAELTEDEGVSVSDLAADNAKEIKEEPPFAGRGTKQVTQTMSDKKSYSSMDDLVSNSRSLDESIDSGIASSEKASLSGLSANSYTESDESLSRTTGDKFGIDETTSRRSHSPQIDGERGEMIDWFSESSDKENYETKLHDLNSSGRHSTALRSSIYNSAPDLSSLDREHTSKNQDRGTIYDDPWEETLTGKILSEAGIAHGALLNQTQHLASFADVTEEMHASPNGTLSTENISSRTAHTIAKPTKDLGQHTHIVIGQAKKTENPVSKHNPIKGKKEFKDTASITEAKSRIPNVYTESTPGGEKKTVSHESIRTGVGNARIVAHALDRSAHFPETLQEETHDIPPKKNKFAEFFTTILEKIRNLFSMVYSFVRSIVERVIGRFSGKQSTPTFATEKLKDPKKDSAFSLPTMVLTELKNALSKRDDLSISAIEELTDLKSTLSKRNDLPTSAIGELTDLKSTLSKRNDLPTSAIGELTDLKKALLKKDSAFSLPTTVLTELKSTLSKRNDLSTSAIGELTELKSTLSTRNGTDIHISRALKKDCDTCESPSHSKGTVSVATLLKKKPAIATVLKGIEIGDTPHMPHIPTNASHSQGRSL